MANSKPLASQRILIMATDGFEQSELEVPLERLQAAGAEVDIASLATGDITGWDGDDWGDDVEVDLKIADVNIDDYAALVLPGGQMNPDLLRVEESAVALIRDFDRAGKSIAAACSILPMSIPPEYVHCHHSHRALLRQCHRGCPLIRPAKKGASQPDCLTPRTCATHQKFLCTCSATIQKTSSTAAGSIAATATGDKR